MSAPTQPPPTAAQARADVRGSDLVRVTVVAASAVVALVGGLIGSGAVVGTPIQEAGGGALAANATMVAPGGPAFSIWSVIYAGLAVLAVYQLLPRQRSDPRQRRTGWWVAASMLLNAAWILTAQSGSVTGALVIIVALLVSLIGAFTLLLRSEPYSTAQAVVLDGIVGLHLGWVAIATVANAAAALVSSGWDPLGPSATAWAVVVLLLAAAVGIGLAVLAGGRLAPAASLAWGLVWIAVARWTGAPLSDLVAVFALSAAVSVVACTVVFRVRHVRDARQVRHDVGGVPGVGEVRDRSAG